MASPILANTNFEAEVASIRAAIRGIRAGMICASSNFKDIAHGNSKPTPVTDSHVTLGVAIRLLDAILHTDLNEVNADKLNRLTISIWEAQSVVSCANRYLQETVWLPQEARDASLLLLSLTNSISGILDEIEQCDELLRLASNNFALAKNTGGMEIGLKN